MSLQSPSKSMTGGTARARRGSTDPVQTPTAPGPALRLLTGAIRFYQLARSGHVSPCRFTPTCSQYALEAVETHGARRGLGLAVRRLGRCRPGGPSGYDPVPE